MSRSGTPARRTALRRALRTSLPVAAVVGVVLVGMAPVVASVSGSTGSGGGSGSSGGTSTSAKSPSATATSAPTSKPTGKPTPPPEPPTPSWPATNGPSHPGAPDDYLPPAGAKFNYPLGTRTQQRILFTHIIRSINSTTPGSNIRIAVFSFADPRTADALIAAYRRGVHVRLVFNSTSVYPSMKRVRDVIGTDTDASSFVVFCHQSCRGTGGQMHAKYFSFNRVGSERDVTMVGSNNLTNHNSVAQWSDLYTVVNDKPYFLLYRHWFGQLKRDTPVVQPYETKSSGDDVVDFAPLKLSEEPDPILTAIKPMACEYTDGDVDPASTTPDKVRYSKIWIAAHAWNGTRGRRIAQAVAAKERAGCRVEVFYGIGMGGAVMDILRAADVAISPGRHQHVRTHEKLMIFQGTYAHVAGSSLAWTGSHNWSNRALGRDDLIVRISDPVVTAQYIAQYKWMWHHG
jgi:hypothetical protein